MSKPRNTETSLVFNFDVEDSIKLWKQLHSAILLTETAIHTNAFVWLPLGDIIDLICLLGVVVLADIIGSLL